MKIVGITGGIGSGKTTVANLFATFGIPVYNADIEAKKLTGSSAVIREALMELLGEKTYVKGVLDRKYMAERIFNDKELLAKVNAIIHPKVASHFQSWVSQQNSPYVLKEAAILFESGSYKQCDKVILVVASKEERIRRVMKRDSISREEVEARMRNQWSDSEKLHLADFMIDNEDISHVKAQVIKLHNLLK